MNLSITKIYTQCLRHLYTNKFLSKSHYEALGLTPKATQADIKSAYYKLSMIYHPDKSQTDDAVNKFRDITEAYEVLGNVKLRRLYDKGMFMGSKKTYPDTENKFYKSREYRSRPPHPMGKIPIYDFDEWSQRHYSETFAKDQETKEFRAFHKKRREDRADAVKHERVIFGIVFLTVIFALIFRTEDYDKVPYDYSISNSRSRNKEE